MSFQVKALGSLCAVPTSSPSSLAHVRLHVAESPLPPRLSVTRGVEIMPPAQQCMWVIEK